MKKQIIVILTVAVVIASLHVVSAINNRYAVSPCDAIEISLENDTVATFLDETNMTTVQIFNYKGFLEQIQYMFQKVYVEFVVFGYLLSDFHIKIAFLAVVVLFFILDLILNGPEILSDMFESRDFINNYISHYGYFGYIAVSLKLALLGVSGILICFWLTLGGPFLKLIGVLLFVLFPMIMIAELYEKCGRIGLLCGFIGAFLSIISVVVFVKIFLHLLFFLAN